MIKKKVATLMAGVLMGTALVGLAGCKDDSAGNSKYATVWSALSTEKYMRTYDAETMDDPTGALEKIGKTEAKLNFVGMKGETQAMQLMITAKQDIKGYDLDVVELKSADGATIAAENIKVYAERYIEIYAPYTNQPRHNDASVQYYSDPGYYPDALVPLEAFQKTREDRVAAGDNQGLWIDVEIPSDAAAGEYVGTFKLTLEDEVTEIPVTLKVYDLTMPEEVHSGSMFNIWYGNLGYGEGDNFDENTNQVYYDYLLKKRLCSGNLNPNLTQTMDAFIDTICDSALDPKVTSYLLPKRLLDDAGFSEEKMLPKIAGTYTEAEVREARAKLKSIFEDVLTKILEKNVALRSSEREEDEKYKELDLFKKLYFYYEDEVPKGYRSERVRVFSGILAEAKKAVYEAKADTFAQYPDLKESMATVLSITTTTEVKGDRVKVLEDEELKTEPDYPRGYIWYDNGTPDTAEDDINCGGYGTTLWCPESYCWRKTGFADEVVRKQALGETFWWYTCVANSPVMSYYVECIPVSMRAYSWLQYQYGVEGILYWDVVQWNWNDNPYEDVLFNGWGGGEGLLLYPGATYGQKEPISSIRMEQLFAGQQDYEYLYMLDGYLQANGMTTTARQIVGKLNEKFFYGYAYIYVDASEKAFEESRIALLDILQDFANGDKEAAQNKIDKIMK